MSYITHSLGKTFYIKTSGKGKAAPLIFLHGGPGGKIRDDATWSALAKTRPVYRYDQLGGGRSGCSPQKHWNIETFVAELEILIDRWKLKEFHLGGGSWGTTLALEYYLRKQGRGIQSLTFMSPMFSAADWKKDADRLILKLPKKMRRVIEVCHEVGATDSKVYHEATMAYYLKHVLRDEKKLAEMMKPKGKQPKNTGREIYQYMWGPSEFEPTGTLKKYDRVKDLKKIAVPTFFICGQHDEAQPHTTRRYAGLVDGATCRVLKGCSHALLAENPKLVTQVVGHFLNRIELNRSSF